MGTLLQWGNDVPSLSGNPSAEYSNTGDLEKESNV